MVSPAGPGARHAACLLAGLLVLGQVYWARLPAPVGAGAAAGTAPGAAAVAGRPQAPRALTPGTSLDGFPDWAPDGGRLAFMRDGRIWIMDAGGQEARAVTAPPEGAWDMAPVWAPDGARLAFIRYHEGGAVRASLALVRPDGGGEQALVQSDDLLGYAAWHPGGGALAYTTGRRLVVLELATGTRRTVADLGEGMDLLPGGLAWSPDGSTLVFGAGPARGAADRPDLNLYRVPAAGGSPVQITTGGGQMPHFAPDGRSLAFRNPRQQAGLYTLDLASGKVTAKQRDQGRHLYFHPRWSPDGRRLAASRLTLGGAGSGAPHLVSAIVLLQ